MSGSIGGCGADRDQVLLKGGCGRDRSKRDYYRYACTKCERLWREINPNQMREGEMRLPLPIHSRSKLLGEYACQKCGAKPKLNHTCPFKVGGRRSRHVSAAAPSGRPATAASRAKTADSCRPSATTAESCLLSATTADSASPAHDADAANVTAPSTHLKVDARMIIDAGTRRGRGTSFA